MAPKRPSFPPPNRFSTPTRELPSTSEVSSRPATPRPNMNSSGDVILGGLNVVVPPSPGPQNLLVSELNSAPDIRANPSRKPPGKTVNDRTGAGIKKQRARAKSHVEKLVYATVGATTALSISAVEKPFRFIELPGEAEVRNLIYGYAFERPKQALLVHRPRIASLRPRTRVDRHRALKSDIKDRELGAELSLTKSRRQRKDPKNVTKRETNRPFWGLTQVCNKIREEFRPIYLHKQEIGMDLTEVVQYLQTFYFAAPAEFAKLTSVPRRQDLPFNGNLTIAVGDKTTVVERSVRGVEVVALLDLWANSRKIEAGFGRYQKNNYNPAADGEAKDLYRLFGRRVLPTRQCSQMNTLWRTILRARALASVTLHRKPANRTVEFSSLVPGSPEYLLASRFVPPPQLVTVSTKPFMHILFRAECAEPWMTDFESEIPKYPHDWLAAHGFANMEHFDIKVGIAPAGLDRRIKL
ncbi:hypothetical protein DE146DRAFT_771951 [Phaeosphaeria sp. MPI-PUGE-AT-0046c]|nr:hypothetical protein DE146DRAFT_771951 [Phaeosphaeria sp. MPI-PUGE-AT-0046c]